MLKGLAISGALALGLCAGGAAGVSAAPLTVGGLTVARPGATVDGLTVADRAVQWGAFVYGKPTPYAPGGGVEPYTPGQLEGRGTSFLYGLDITSPEPFGTLNAKVRAGQDLLLPAQAFVTFTFNRSEDLGVLRSQARDGAKSFRDSYDLQVTVNGVDFETSTGRDVFRFRERYPSGPKSPNVSLLDRENSWVKGFLSPEDYDETYGQTVVADGYWLLFKDVPFGAHSIVVTATDRVSGAVHSEVTHKISAVPLPAGLVLMLGGVAALGAVRLGGRSRSAQVASRRSF